MTEVFFPGIEGTLQGVYKQQASGLVALVLPPYPKYGGTMNNKVVCALSDAFIKNGFSTLRMNFRGVQKSSGDVSNSDNELLKDAASAINWLQDHNPIISEFWFAGFSFGAWMAANLIMRRPEATGFITVAPPVERYDFSFLMPCLVPGLIMQGDNDVLTDYNAVERLAQKLQLKVPEIQYNCIQGGDYRLSRDEDVNMIRDLSTDYVRHIINDESISTSVPDKESVYELQDV